MSGSGSTRLSPTEFTHFIQPRKSLYITRILAVILSLTFLYIVVIRTSVPSDWRLPVHDQSSQSTQIESFEQEEQITTPIIVAHTTASALIDAQKDEVVKVQAQHEAEANTKNQPTNGANEKVQEDGKHGKPVYYNIQTAEPYNLEQGIHEVLALLPDEIYTRDLLKPIIGGGEKRMREVGLRARLFRKYLAAWETLHVVSDSSHQTALVRDDIIQHLRNTEDLSFVSPLPRAEIIRQYEQYRSFLAKFAATLFPWTAPYFANHMTLHAHAYNSGRGLVLSGNDNSVGYMMTSITSMRRLGCNLPIEIFYLGDDDLGEEDRETLETLPGVSTRDLKQMVVDKGWELKGWAIKPFAILLSSFREVIFLDSDSMFLQNPNILFEDPAYLDTGALFFKDRLLNPSDKRKFLRQILPRPVSEKARTSRFWTGESQEMQESGCIVIDKWKHFVSLLVITRMNGPDRDDIGDNKGVYSFFYGDKETFWLGFELAGDTDYNFHQGNAASIGPIMEITRFKSAKPSSTVNEQSQQSGSDHNGSEQGPQDGSSGQLEDEQRAQEAADKIVETPDGNEPEPLEQAQDNDYQGVRRREFPWEERETVDAAGYSYEEVEAMTNVNFTLCSAQLLHLDIHGRPLWFNGWIQDDKFDHDKSVAVTSFEYFLSERRQLSEEIKASGNVSVHAGPMADWSLGGHNWCCLKSDSVFRLTEEEKGVLDMIVSVARDLGAVSS